MQKHQIGVAVVKKNGVIQQIGKSSIYLPKTNFCGERTKWYEDKPKKKEN